MNLTNFIKQTDAVAAQYTAKQLALFIHDIGRTLPEREREDFLRRLKAVGAQTERIRNEDRESEIAFEETYRQVLNNLNLIDSQEITISNEINEEYDDWNGGEEFFYVDKDGVSGKLEQACRFVHTCMDRERYREGFEIGRQLLSMEVYCESEYENEELSIGEMADHDLLHYDLKLLALDAAYCAYLATVPAERPKAVYEIMANSKTKEIILESVLQHGDEELPDVQTFLSEWIEYLSGRIGCEPDRLIMEAVGLLGDVRAATVFAFKYADVHPGLYMGILESGKSADAVIPLGIEAIKAIPKKYTMRSKVALKTAEYMIQEGYEQEAIHKCYFAAYESDTSVTSYLRALFHGYGSEEKRNELKKVFMEFPKTRSSVSPFVYGGYDYSVERRENNPDKNDVLAIRFFDGQFFSILRDGLNVSEALGWTGTFMKQGIALYLLCLCKGRMTGKGMKEMFSIARKGVGFSAEEYQKGICDPEAADEDAFFAEIFLKWKQMIKMEPDIRLEAVKKITDLIEKRTAGIMDANRRNYYGECAAFIAALGEAQESLGDSGAKQRLMTSYKEKYFRRTAFKAELRAYGWIDVKKR